MTFRDDLVLIGWLSTLAPESALLPGAGPLAVAAARGAFPAGDGLDEGLANCLRRSAATAMLQCFEPAAAAHAQQAVMARKDAFRAALDRHEPALVVIAGLIAEVEGLGKFANRIAPSVIEAFRVQGRDLFPREESGGARLAIGVLEALLAGADPHGRYAVERELASLHQRAGDPGRAAELRGAEDGFSSLDAADQSAGRGDMDQARQHLGRAQRLFERAGLLAGLAAVKRREAALLDPPDRIPLLLDAVRLSRSVPDDHRGVVEGLEELSRAFAESGRTGPAVAALGEIAGLQRAAADAVGEARALQLAGRLLCEAFGEQQEAGPGLVMLLFAADIGGTVDPVLSDLTHRYVQGFQYTLSDAEWSAVEPLFDQDRGAVVDATFARYRTRYAEELP